MRESLTAMLCLQMRLRSVCNYPHPLTIGWYPMTICQMTSAHIGSRLLSP